MIFKMSNQIYVSHMCFKVRFINVLGFIECECFNWKTKFIVCKHIHTLMSLYNNSLFGIVCMCAGVHIYIYIYICICVRKRVCVTHILVCTHTWTLHVCMSHAFHTLVLSVRLRARVCVLPSEMECVIFYSRKIAHRANVICCIMYPTLIYFYLILSYLILSYLILSYLIWSHLHLISSHLISISSHLISSHLISSHPISSYLILSLIHIMACRLFGAKALCEPMLNYCWLDH